MTQEKQQEAISPPVPTLSRQPLDFFRLIPQQAVKHKLFENCTHNASFDILETKEGRVFFSLCAELQTTNYVHLYEYLPDTNAFRLHFRLEDITFQQDIAIRPSKFHTSIAEMNDGRLIMASHTTAQSPLHPAWMPGQYYYHQFEGYQGSDILIYDPRTGAVEHRGIPVPRESIYGGVYDATYNAYYFSGMMRNHAYRFDIDSNEIKDLGQLSESSVYKMTAGPDGHIYSSTKMGRMFRINVDKQCIEDLGLQIPLDCPDSSYTSRMQIGHCAWHPDGRLYCAVTRHPHLFRFDPKAVSLEDLGQAAVEYTTNKSLNWPTGLIVDEKGIVWYGVTTPVEDGVRLYSYDPATGEKVSWGFLGSSQRSLRIVSEMAGHRNTIYILDSNHGLGSMGVLTVDVSKLRQEDLAAAPYSQDAALYMRKQGGRDIYPYDKDAYDRQVRITMQRAIPDNASWAVVAQNPETFAYQEGWTYKLWQRVGTENSQVRELEWLDNETLTGICGHETPYAFTIRARKLISLEPTGPYEEKVPDLSAYEGLALPYVSGRQYKAVASAAITLCDGSVLIGTEDAMAAIYKDGRVFSLGQAAPYGPIRAFATDNERKKVYGIACYPLDLGSVFSYDVETGLKQEGRISVYANEPDYFADSTDPSAIAVSPDGRYVAFGVEDRLGVVYICRVKD